MKKKAIEAEAVVCWMDVPWKDRRIAIIILCCVSRVGLVVMQVCFFLHGNSETERSPHHWIAPSQTVKEERWDKRAEEKHGVYGTAENEGQVAGYADVLF